MRTEWVTSEQIETYERDGYLVFPGVFSASECAEMARAADELIELTVNASLATGRTSPRLDVQRRDGKVILRKIQPVNDVSPVLKQYSEDERLVGPLRQILGCDPVLMEEKLNYKQILPGSPELESGEEGEGFAFHTDLAYFYLDGYPVETLSSALSIDETTPDNGPIRILPGSHKRLDWPLRGGWPPILADGAVPEDDVIPMLAPPGSVMVFHSALVHASSPNRTQSPRRLMIYSHYPSTHVVEPDKRNRHLREAGQDHEREYSAALERGFSPSYSMT